MVCHLQENALEYIFGLSILALALLLLRIWRGRKPRGALARDKSGFWKYHKETQYLLKSAYSQQLLSKEARKVLAKAKVKSAEEDPEERKCLISDVFRTVLLLFFPGISLWLVKYIT